MFVRLAIIFCFNIFFYNISFSQSSVRVAVYGGGSLNFVFNSISDYNTGITYTNWTTIGMEVVDDPFDAFNYISWDLKVEADDADGDGFLTGSGLPVNQLPFGVIEVQATLAAGCASCNFYGSPFIALTNAPSVALVDGTNDPLCPCPPGDQLGSSLDLVSDQVSISYRCGVTTNLIAIGASADYYSDDIFFTVEMDIVP